MNTFIFLLLFLFPLATAVCRTTINIPHASVTIPFSAPTSILLPLHLSHPCKLLPVAPLILLIPGALTRPNDYDLFTKLLAQKGFITALPDYTTRPITSLPVPQLQNLTEHVTNTIENGFDCPPNTQSVTTAAVQSVLSWFSGRENAISKAADLMNVMLFGHSQGGAAMDFFLSEGCIPFSQPINGTLEEILRDGNRVAEVFPRIICEQYTPSVIRGVRVAGVVSYEGLPPGNVTIPGDVFHIAMHSAFAQQDFTNLSERIVGGGRMLRVMLEDANHFGVNDFFEGNQTPPCALMRPPPENAFRTTRKVQDEVVQSVAGVTYAAFEGLVRGRFAVVVAPRVGEIEIVN